MSQKYSVVLLAAGLSLLGSGAGLIHIFQATALECLPSRIAIIATACCVLLSAILVGVAGVAGRFRAQHRNADDRLPSSETELSPDDLLAKTNQQLQESEHRFRTSIETMLDCFGIYRAIRDENGQIVDFRVEFINDAACLNNQMSREEQLGKNLCELLPSHRESGLFEAYCQVVETGQPLVKDALFYEDQYGQCCLMRAFDIRAAKSGDGFVCTWRDVTDRYQMQEEVRRSQQELESLVGNLPDVVSRFDRDLRYLYNSPSVEAITGLPPSALLGKTMADLSLPATTTAIWGAALRSVFATGQPQVIEFSQAAVNPMTQDGCRYYQTRFVPEITSHEIRSVLAVTHDITSLKQAEIALTQANERFRLAMAAVNSAVYDWDVERNQVNRTEGIHRLFGFLSNEIEDSSEWWMERIHPDDSESMRQAFLAALAQEERYSLEYRVRNHQNQYIDVHDQGLILRDSSARAVRVVGSVTDISERKRVEAQRQQAELALRQSEAAAKQAEEIAKARAAEVEAFMEAVPAGVWIAHDPQCHSVTPNRAAYKMMRRSPDSVMTATPPEGGYPFPFKIQQQGQEVAPQDLPMQQAGRTGQEVAGEFEFVFDDGDVCSLYGKAVPLKNELGDVRGVIGAFIDITARKQIEEALRESEARLQLALQGTGQGIWDWDLAQQQLTWDDRCKAIFGLPPDFSVTYEWHINALHPDDRQRVQNAGTAVLQQGCEFEEEYRTFWPDGTMRWVLARGRGYNNALGEPYRVAGTVLDITDRKQAEAALRQSQARSRQLVDSNLIGIVFSDFEGHLLEANQAFLQMVGYTQEELSQLDWRVMTPPEYAHLDEQAIAELRIKGVCTPFEKEYFRKDGSRVPILIGFAAIEGTRQECACFVLDLTQQKQNEQALRENQVQLNLALEAAGMGSWDWDVQTGEVVWTPDHEMIFGYEPGTPKRTYQDWLDRIYPDDADQVLALLKQAMHAKQNFTCDYRVVWQNGSIHWVSAYGRFHYDDKGHPVRMLGMLFEITDRKQTEAALRDSELRFRTLADTMPQLFWVVRSDSYHEYCNQRWYDYTGLTLEQAHQQGWQTILHPDDRQRTAEAWQAAIQSGETFEVEYRLRCAADGQYRWHLSRAFPLIDPDSHILKWFGSCTDIHDQKLAIEERAQALERERAARIELERASRMKDEFLAVVSHELRSPLNAILGWSRLLRTRAFDPDRTEQALATIERNAQAQTQLIEDLLDISRIIRGAIRLDLRPTDLVPCIRAAIDTVRPAANAKSILIGFQFASDVGTVAGDPDRLQQIVWNLLSNAVKFTPVGGRVTVHLSLVRERLPLATQSVLRTVGSLQLAAQPYAQITVSDTGKGIHPDFLPYVFERFRQADSTTTRTQGGLGLGLAIVRNLLELHGGTIQVDSAGEGQGTTFTVRLPLLLASLHEPDANYSGLHRQTALETPLNLTGLKILAVDDEVDTREFLKTALEQYGATVTIAASAAEALNLLQTQRPDVLLSDIGMPDEDGYALMRRIRALPPDQGGQTPAAALTAYAREGDRLQALAAGFQMHIPKPIEPIQLLTVIVKLIGDQQP